MARELIYLPVERYSTRWTEYVSGSFGMFVAGASGARCRLTIVAPDNNLRQVKQGSVVDFYERAEFAFSQVMELLGMIYEGRINNDSVLYIEDFWLPGMEMIPYACHIKGIRPKVYAFCHAQSVDPNDFTRGMLPWIRAFEIGWAQWLTGIFVADQALKTMMVDSKMCAAAKVHVCGTIFDRSVLVHHYYDGARLWGNRRKPTILFTSRLDKEKCPTFFYLLSERALRDKLPWQFLIVTGTSVPPAAERALTTENLKVMQQVSKHVYFKLLATSAVMLNAAKQDFIGYCQLDALAYGCWPLCPRYLTFPGLFQNDDNFLYEPDNVDDAMKKLTQLVPIRSNMLELMQGEVPGIYARFGSRFEGSVERMMNVMFGEQGA